MTQIAIVLALILTIAGCDATPTPGGMPDAAASGPTCTPLTADGVLLGCAGTFGGTVKPACPTGYAACKTLPATQQAAVACAKDQGGFFAADLTAYGVAGSEMCQPRGTVDAYGLYGCGSKASRGTVRGGDPCGGFNYFIWCDGQSGWTCPAGLSQGTNTNAADGVLCCKS